MSTPDDNSEFERRTKVLFDRSVEQLDAATRTRLAQARASALDELEPRAAHRRWRVWAPAAGLAAAALATVAVLFEKRSGSQRTSPLDDLELLANEDLDMMQELDFYAWLDEQPDFKGEA